MSAAVLNASGLEVCYAGNRVLKLDRLDIAAGEIVGVIGANDAGGFGLAVTLEVSLPHLPLDEARALADKAHQVCPYSIATRGNIDVDVIVVED